MPPFLMASARFIVAGALLATILLVLKRFRISRQQLWDNTFIGALLILGGNGLVSWAQQKVPSGMTTLILSLNPLFVVIADWAVLLIFRDHTRGSVPKGLTFLGLALGIAGLSVLIGPSLVATDSTHLEGFRVLGLVVACLSWCIGSLYSRYAKEPADPFSGAAVQMLIGGLWLRQPQRMGAELRNQVKSIPLEFGRLDLSNIALIASLRLSVCSILLGAAKQLGSQRTFEPKQAVQSTIAFMKAHLGEPVSIEEVSAAVH